MEYYGIPYLNAKLIQKELGVGKRYRFYEMKNQVLDFGISTPPELKGFKAVLGWCAKGVDSLADRLDLYGFKDDVFDLDQIYSMNNKDILFSSAMLGALMGFLMFNVKPAMVFMGDTGSLALGGFVAGCAYMMRMPIFIIIIGLVYLVEVLSVIIQVTYFKKTGGKRFFRMAPIHHHFELMGWSEPRVDAVFTIVTVLLCMIAYVGM
jgi:hypothetical protein